MVRGYVPTTWTFNNSRIFNLPYYQGPNFIVLDPVHLNNSGTYYCYGLESFYVRRRHHLRHFIASVTLVVFGKILLCNLWFWIILQWYSFRWNAVLYVSFLSHVVSSLSWAIILLKHAVILFSSAVLYPPENIFCQSICCIYSHWLYTPD